LRRRESPFQQIKGLPLAATYWDGMALTGILITSALTIALRAEAQTPPKGPPHCFWTIIASLKAALSRACSSSLWTGGYYLHGGFRLQRLLGSTVKQLNLGLFGSLEHIASLF
jgi:hypothetical protein